MIKIHSSSNSTLVQKNKLATAKEKTIEGASKQNEANKAQKRPASGHLQLLSLAKQFGLDGLLTQSKQNISIDERAKKREQIKRIRKQQNLENIMRLALNFANEGQSQVKIDPDWFNSFQILAEDVSNPSMQELWARILVGEIANPGSFSFKALKTFRDMNINEAKVFAKACALAVKDTTRNSLRLITGYYLKPSILASFSRFKSARINLNDFGLSYVDILQLSNIGILYSDEIESKALNKGSKLQFSYNGLSLSLSAVKNDCVVNFYTFTQTGTELAKLINDAPNLAYFDNLRAKFGHQFTIG